MAKKKEFFSSFEKNLSFDQGTGTNGNAVIAEPAPKELVVDTTLAVQKEEAPVKKAPVSKAVIKKSVIKKVDTNNTAPLTKVTTFRINVDLLEQIKAIAYWDREKIQDVLDTALTNYVKSVPEKELEKAVKAFQKSS